MKILSGLSRQISELLKARNNLPDEISPYKISYENYFYIKRQLENGRFEVISCAWPKKISFFMYELKHLCVKEGFDGGGLGSLMIDISEKYIKDTKTPIVIATTNITNKPINHLFNKKGYKILHTFKNENTQNECYLWQKIL